MTPEQSLRQKLTNLIKRTLPKGRYVLQPIETNQVGVPDFYFIFNKQSMWFETKTTEYCLEPYQYNWASTHERCGGVTYVLTHLPTPPKPNAKTHILAPPAYLRLPQPTQHNPVATPTCSSAVEHPSKTSISNAGLYLLSFDAKMTDYSTLGRYINAERPQLRALEDLLYSLLVSEQLLNN